MSDMRRPVNSGSPIIELHGDLDKPYKVFYELIDEFSDKSRDNAAVLVSPYPFNPGKRTLKQIDALFTKCDEHNVPAIYHIGGWEMNIWAVDFCYCPLDILEDFIKKHKSLSFLKVTEQSFGGDLQPFILTYFEGVFALCKKYGLYLVWEDVMLPWAKSPFERMTTVKAEADLLKKNADHIIFVDKKHEKDNNLGTSARIASEMVANGFGYAWGCDREEWNTFRGDLCSPELFGINNTLGEYRKDKKNGSVFFACNSLGSKFFEDKKEFVCAAKAFISEISD